MGRRSTIEKHPNRADIERDLIDQVPFREIALRYDVGIMSVVRYHDGPMARKLAMAVAQRELEEGQGILELLEDMLAKVNKLITACDEYLTDPDDPTKYNLHARDEEVIISVQEKYEEGETPPPRIRLSLAEALEQINDKGYITHSMKYRHADPRNLILQGANTLKGQMQLLVNMSAELRKTREGDITRHPEYQRLEHEIAQVLSKHPKALQEIRDVFGT